MLEGPFGPLTFWVHRLRVMRAPVPGCTTSEIDIGGQLLQAQGDVIDIDGPANDAIKTVSVHPGGNGFYGGTTASGTYYFANVDSENVISMRPVITWSRTPHRSK